MAELKQGFSEVHDNIIFMQNTTIMLIGQLKSTIKKEDMQRLEKRIDAWSPECIICREEAKKIVDRSFSKEAC
jgi:hypothetical protein